MWDRCCIVLTVMLTAAMCRRRPTVRLDALDKPIQYSRPIGQQQHRRNT